MSVYYPKTSLTKITDTHTINEFINMGLNSSDNNTYRDLSYFETRNGMEFIVKTILDDHIDILLENTVTVLLEDKDVRRYKFNPKMLSYDLYGTTKLFYIIMRLNGICNVHEFNLHNREIKLIPSTAMSKAISSIFKEEKFSLQTYNNKHKNDIIVEEIEKYK